jgi:hypothetical protein
MPVHNQRWFGQWCEEDCCCATHFLTCEGSWFMCIIALIVSRWQWSESAHEGSWRLWQWCALCQGSISSYLLLFATDCCLSHNHWENTFQLLTWQTIASLLLQLSSDLLQSSENNLTPSMLVLQVIFGKIFVSHNNKIVMSIYCISMSTYGWEGWGGGNCSIYSVVIS